MDFLRHSSKTHLSDNPIRALWSAVAVQALRDLSSPRVGHRVRAKMFLNGRGNFELFASAWGLSIDEARKKLIPSYMDKSLWKKGN